MKMQFSPLLTAIASSLSVSAWAQLAARLPTVAILSDGGPPSCCAPTR